MMLVGGLGTGWAAALAALQLGTGGASAQAPAPSPATAASTAPAPAGAKPPRARANLASYLSDSDYPDEAIRRGEQGIAAFRLDVDTEGKVARCTIVQSSASAILDETTCRIMTERARFDPARDTNGRAVPDSVHSRIHWVLPEKEFAPRKEVALSLWMACTMGEAAKLALSPLPARQVADKALAKCTELEAVAVREVGPPPASVKDSIRQGIEEYLNQARRVMADPPRP